MSQFVQYLFSDEITSCQCRQFEDSGDFHEAFQTFSKDLSHGLLIFSDFIFQKCALLTFCVVQICFANSNLWVILTPESQEAKSLLFECLRCLANDFALKFQARDVIEFVQHFETFLQNFQKLAINLNFAALLRLQHYW